MLYRASRSFFRFLFSLIFKFKVIGKHHVPDQGGVVLCCNHTSLMDPLVLGTPVDRQVHYMAKAELFKIPVVGWLIKQWGAIPVKRGGVSKETIRTFVNILNDQKVMGIFPEGTRNSASGMGKKGAASLALRSNATVIPVAIIGKYKLFNEVTIVFGEPVDLSEFPNRPSSEELELATSRIMAAIQNIRKQYEMA